MNPPQEPKLHKDVQRIIDILEGKVVPPKKSKTKAETKLIKWAKRFIKENDEVFRELAKR